MLSSLESGGSGRVRWCPLSSLDFSLDPWGGSGGKERGGSDVVGAGSLVGVDERMDVVPAHLGDRSICHSARRSTSIYGGTSAYGSNEVAEAAGAFACDSSGWAVAVDASLD